MATSRISHEQNPHNTQSEKGRCLGCHNWTSEWAMVGKYYPWKAIPSAPKSLHAVYFLCPKCADKVRKGGRIARRVTDNVEGYLNDDLREAHRLWAGGK